MHLKKTNTYGLKQGFNWLNMENYLKGNLINVYVLFFFAGGWAGGGQSCLDSFFSNPVSQGRKLMATTSAKQETLDLS